MSKEKDAFLTNMAERIGYNPTAEDRRLGDITEKFYENLRSGEVREHVTTTVVLYAKEVLPELSCQQAAELTAFVHVIIETVLTYLVEDGLIKEE